MDLLRWWRDHTKGLIPNRATWKAQMDHYWPRIKQKSLDVWTRSEKTRFWAALHPNLAFAPVGTLGILYLLRNQQDAPAATLIGAWFFLARHFAQTEADRRRRISESYSKAVGQLASDKIEERLGGIYTLESISKESPDDDWTVMETLTAFVRERSQRNESERTAVNLDERLKTRAYFLWRAAGLPKGPAEKHRAEALDLDRMGDPPATDIDAVLTVIKRRGSRNREAENSWCLDFSRAVLRQGDLLGAHLEGANLWGAYLEGADGTCQRL